MDHVMPRNSARFFFILSGEHPTLPLAELKAIFHAYAIEYKIVGSFYKLIEIEADRAKLESIASRGAYVDEMGEEVLHTEDNLESIKREVEFANLKPFLTSEDSFSIRMLRFGGVSKELSRVHLEGYLGKLLADKTGAKVDLRSPKKTFLDPFCGVGGIAIEASLLGCNVVGVDALSRMVRSARRNLAHFGLKSYGLVRGDARNIPLRSVDAIATDPPYGTGASTLKSTTKDILASFLPQAKMILSPGGKVVFASPLGTGAVDLAESQGFKVYDRHELYVHRSLTREILVLGAN